ncbi:MAG: hypothetical protein LBS19_15975 [Clostridiales bacterium]|jgi:hypothetical protein|nr:hypothetical protein [Clostridiales bacterium]
MEQAETRPGNRAKTGNRDNTGRFRKGVSGNPSGRPAQPEEFKEILRSATVPALRLLVKTMNDGAVKPELRVKCAEILIDRALGKATQPIEASVSSPAFDWGDITTDELRRLAELNGLETADDSAGSAK